jgi:hypothetical protein
VTTVIPAEGLILERILDATWPASHEGLHRHDEREAIGHLLFLDEHQKKSGTYASIWDSLGSTRHEPHSVRT